MLDKMVTEGFLAPPFASMLTFSDDICLILEAFRANVPPASKWTSPAGVEP